MRAIVIISCLFLAALALFLLAQVGFIFSFRAKATHQTRHALPESPVTNPAAGSPGGFYVGKGDQQVYVNYATPDPLLRSFMQSVMQSGSGPNAKGKEIFGRICAACHQPDGQGKDGIAPPLVGSEWVLARGGGRLVRIVLNGLTGPVRVRGRIWNLAMPPWRENLDDDQVAVVLTYVRSQLGSNRAGEITPEFVAAARRETRTKPETSADLLRVSNR
jgi:mono/diheme cytochrome c family protein